MTITDNDQKLLPAMATGLYVATRQLLRSAEAHGVDDIHVRAARTMLQEFDRYILRVAGDDYAKILSQVSQQQGVVQ